MEVKGKFGNGGGSAKAGYLAGFSLVVLWLASRTGRNCSFKKKTGAGESGFGFLEFGDIHRSDVEAARFDAGASAREGSGKNDGAAECQSIGGVRLAGHPV